MKPVKKKIPRVDPKLVDIFLYHFGVDLNESKYDEGRQELANFFIQMVVDTYQPPKTLLEERTEDEQTN